jgi:hypothetical protein
MAASTPKGLTHQHLLSHVHYDPETGMFTRLARADRLKNWNARYAGQPAGWIEKGTQRRRISIDEVKYLDSVLAWFYMTGEWAPVEIDHHDTDPLNCRWGNLRLASRSQNIANQRLRRCNSSGFKGVTWQRRERKWYAKITVNYRQINLGLYDSAEAAHAAYIAAAEKHFGEFARAA